MNLDESQKKAVSGWIADGLKLAEIQKRLATDFGVTVTYMEVRFLVDDLKLLPKDPPPPKADLPPSPQPASPPSPSSGAGSPALSPPTPAGALPGPAGNVSVNVDTVTRPGTLVSGNVQFSDGQSAAWYLDQMGRLGLMPKQQGYKPSAPDLESFQRGLEAELSKLGF